MKYRLTVKGDKWTLEEPMTANELLDLSNELYAEGIYSDASWWLARWHETKEGGTYWDNIQAGHLDTETPFQCMHDACFNLSGKLTDNQCKIARGEKRGSFEAMISA